MVKLSAELIEQAAQYTNPVRDRELDLRGYKIPVLENLGATLDQFDTIDFSDNEIRKLDGFPLLKRLKTLLMNNNRICRVGENLEQALPSMRELILTSNNIQELGDLDPLASVKTLTLLSLLRNPVTNKKHYRLYVINKIPQIHVLDFQKVKLKERQEAEKMFKGKRGAQLAKDIAKRTKTFTPGAAVQQPEKKKMGPSPADVEAIKNAIANASSLAEVERLKGMLQAGQIPDGRSDKVPPEMVEVEEEENGVVHMEREIQTEEGNGVEEMEEDVVEVQGKVEEVQGKVEEVDVKEVEEVDVKEVEEVEKEEVEEEEGREEGEEQESEEDESEDDDMDEDSPVNGS
ncbi:U2 small nuclear ribonucleoprotein A' [Salmo salar]|uniref:U2 small nuclear ribonucleoprotein A' n=1 Tax=Salmo salar TaxID=8030 RepID=A0ABM3EEZ4_SALSA|nr:U2 small nuclear ribonucleoprotein A' [Salmo salar]